MNSYINAVGKATAPYRVKQAHIADFMCETLQLSPEKQRELKILYRATGINYRYSAIKDFGNSRGNFSFFPNEKNTTQPGVSNRMALFKETAPKMAFEAISNCFEGFEGYDLKEITHIITISCTGLYAPGLGIEIINHFGLNKTIQRTGVNFMGCYGAFNGLKVADNICRANPEAKVLMVSVELCSIHFQDSTAPDDLLAASLFADGSAAAILSSQATSSSLKVESFHCDLNTDGIDEMAWDIGDTGFNMRLTQYIPELVGKGIPSLVKDLFSGHNIQLEDISHYAIHPGGKGILQKIEEVLEIKREKNKFAHEVLREYGNMSSATVLFVLDAVLDEIGKTDKKGNVLSMAFGPGLTLESAFFKYVQ